MVIGRMAQAPYDLVPCEVEHQNGEWVKYEDIKHLLGTKPCNHDLQGPDKTLKAVHRPTTSGWKCEVCQEEWWP